MDVTAAGLLDLRAERAAIDAVLQSVRGGFSAALVIRGSTGVGKTALLGYAAESATDVRVFTKLGVSSRAQLARQMPASLEALEH